MESINKLQRRKIYKMYTSHDVEIRNMAISLYDNVIKTLPVYQRFKFYINCPEKYDDARKILLKSKKNLLVLGKYFDCVDKNTGLIASEITNNIPYFVQSYRLLDWHYDKFNVKNRNLIDSKILSLLRDKVILQNIGKGVIESTIEEVKLLYILKRIIL